MATYYCIVQRSGLIHVFALLFQLGKTRGIII